MDCVKMHVKNKLRATSTSSRSNLLHNSKTLHEDAYQEQAPHNIYMSPGNICCMIARNYVKMNANNQTPCNNPTPRATRIMKRVPRKFDDVDT